MSRQFSTTGSYLQVLTSPLANAGVPCTLALWARRRDLTLPGARLAVGTSSTTTNAFELIVASTGTVSATTRSSAGASSSATTAALWLDASSWHHACGVFASATSRIAYFDGANAVSQTTSRTVSTLNRLAINSGPTGASTGSGFIANVAIWKAALTDGEVLMLGQGTSPRLVRADALVFYLPRLGTGETEVDVIGGLKMAPNGTWNLGTSSPEEPPNYNVDRRPHSPRIFLMSPPGSSIALMGQSCL